MIEQIPDYAIFLDKMLHQWQNSPNLKGIIAASMVQANKIEAAIFEIRDLMNLDTASGINLDVLGKPWNEERGGRTDAAYRAAIRQKKLQAFSGEPETIISILKGGYSASAVFYTPEYPGKYRVRSDADVTLTQLQEISMAGIQGFLSGNLIDALDNNIVDANGNNIIHVAG